VSGHTPAPWFTHREGFSTVYVEARLRQGVVQEVAACGPTEAGAEQQEANARLIAAAPSGWQAIETAPKDGTAVLVYQKIDSAHWLITPAYFAGGHWLIVCFHDGNVEYEIAPTHWQPLPAPPAPNQGEAS
jgi:hypothetical protein